MPTRLTTTRLKALAPALALALATCLTPVARAQPADPFGLDALESAAEPEVTREFKASLESVSPGDQLVVAIILEHADGWHSHTNDPLIPKALAESGFVAIATEVKVTGAEGVTPGTVQWPPTHAAPIEARPGELVDYLVFDGRAVIYVPFLVADDASETVRFSLSVTNQACNESLCIAPETVTRTIELPVVPIEQRATQSTDPDFGSFDPSVFADRANFGANADSGGGGAVTRPTFFGVSVPAPDSPAGIALVALLAAAGGFILNLTPCVLPVIPIKIMTISKHAGSPGKSMYLGAWMAAGVVFFWGALGVLAASFTSLADPSRLFGFWQFTLPIGILIGAMGVGIMGAFNIKLPQAVYAVNPKADSARGSFMFGMMTAVLGLPCFGFVAGALLAGAAALPTAVIITIFLALGVGMAAPYLVLSARPGLLEKMPRTGPASDLVKQTLGLLMLAAASFFIGAGALALLGGMERFATGLPWWAKTVHWWFVALFAAAAGLWLLVRTFQITRKPINRTAFALVALVLASGGVLAAVDRTDHAFHNFWIPFTPETLADATARGDVVVLDFTAEWCLNCKTLEATVLSRDPVKPLLLSPGVVPMVADVTSTAAPGWDKLRDLGQTGIPLLVIFGPGLDEPWQANAYTPQMVVDAIDRARGSRDVTLAD